MKITATARRQAAAICAAMASSRNVSQSDVADAIGAGSDALLLADLAFVAACGVFLGLRRTDALAEAMLRTGWRPGPRQRKRALRR
jgi:hypothetical protein